MLVRPDLPARLERNVPAENLDDACGDLGGEHLLGFVLREVVVEPEALDAHEPRKRDPLPQVARFVPNRCADREAVHSQWLRPVRENTESAPRAEYTWRNVVSQHTRVRIEDGIAFITIDDGKVNALSSELIGEVGEAFDAAKSAGAVAVLRGREGIFSAGFDLGAFKRGPEATVAMLRAGAGLILRLLAFPRPVLSVCTGHAYPMGAFLMLSADVRFALAGEWRIGMNEVAIGLTVPKFAVELARHRLTPAGFARITTGPMFAPEEAMRLGYVDRVLDADQLDHAVSAETTRLRALDVPSFAATKARINERALQAIAAAVDAELPAASSR